MKSDERILCGQCWHKGGEPTCRCAPKDLTGKRVAREEEQLDLDLPLPSGSDQQPVSK